jgi:hypothetical protein
LIRRLGALILILLTVFAILVGVTRILGKPSTVPTTLQPSPSCAIGCWIGIHIGKTTMGEAETILLESHFMVRIDSSWHHLTLTDRSGAVTLGTIYPVYDNSGKWRDTVDRIYLSLYDESLSLGDAILLWGTPIGTNTQFCSYPTNGWLTIYFESDVQVEVNPARQINNVSLSPSALTPNTVITRIGYVSKDNSYFPRELQSWKGFVHFPPNFLVSDYCG